MITPRDRRLVMRLIKYRLWTPYTSFMRLPEIKTVWGTRWLYKRMLKRQARDERHHAPCCPANHYHYTRLVFHQCTCGAR